MDKGSALPVPPEMGQAGQLNVGQADFLSCISEPYGMLGAFFFVDNGRPMTMPPPKLFLDI